MDPFAAYKNSRNVLFQSMDAKAEQDRRAPLDALRLKAGEQQLAASEQALADQQAAKDFGATMKGKSPLEMMQGGAEFAAAQGNIPGAVDLSAKMSEAQLKMHDTIAKAFRQGGEEHAKAVGKMLGGTDEQVAQISGTMRQGEDLIRQLPNGGVIYSVYDDIKDSYHPMYVPPRDPGGGGAPRQQDRSNQTKTLMGPDGKPHEMGFNEETKRYDIDMGVAKMGGASADEALAADGSLTVNGFHYTEEMLRGFGERFNKSGKMPALGMKAGPIRNAIMYYSGLIAEEEGKTGYEVAGGFSESKAQQKSLEKLKPTIDFAEAFMSNLDAQIDRVDGIFNDIQQEYPRLINIPIRQWEEKVQGTEARAKIKLYITEIANESARLSAGNPQSIAEISAAAAAKWDKIHDLDMPISAMKGLLKETKRAGEIRRKSLNDQYAKVLAQSQSTPTRLDKGMTQKQETQADLPNVEDAPEGAIGYDPDKKEWVFE